MMADQVGSRVTKRLFPGRVDALDDATGAMEIMVSTANCSIAASRCSDALGADFSNPARLGHQKLAPENLLERWQSKAARRLQQPCPPQQTCCFFFLPDWPLGGDGMSEMT
jgi:hypothetical protein